MVRVALNVVHYPVFGGPHNRLLRLAEPLREHGWKTVAVLPDDPGDAAGRLRAGGIDVVQMPLGRLRASRDPRRHLGYALKYPSDVVRLYRLIRRRRPGLVLIGGLVNAQAALAARLAGVPMVWQMVDSRTPKPVARAFFRVVERLADAVMFNGRAIEHLHTGGRTPRVPALVYYPPVDTQRFVPSLERRRAAREALGTPAEASLVGMVANINRQKGIEVFVRAAARVHRARPDCRFIVIGPFYEAHRDYTAQVMDEVRKSRLPAGHLIFTGGRSDVHELYPAMDVKLISSRPRSEGTTTTAMEALACGVPVVATDVGAVRDVVEDGATGFVVPPLDDRAIADATVRLLDDPDLRARMGTEGRRRAIERWDVRVSAATHATAFAAALANRTGGSIAPAAAVNLCALLVCPACRQGLKWNRDSIQCEACGRVYPIVDDIPVLLTEPGLAEHDELDHHHDGGSDHKRRQATYFDRRSAEAEEFEITRPHGAASLYRRLLAEKLRRSLRRIEHLLPGAIVANVCGGAGMDAEFLARRGARVVLIDISLGAARRSRERARRTRLAITPVVADVEQLPLRDHGADIAYVHDGLHHLEDPQAGLREMARVAARAVSVTEPAQAAITALAVRCGLALEREEAGNRVARLTPGEVARTLAEHGFRTATAERYAMYYRHRPGTLAKVLSLPGLQQAALAALRVLNLAGGRFGNKLAVVAVRIDE